MTEPDGPVITSYCPNCIAEVGADAGVTCPVCSATRTIGKGTIEAIRTEQTRLKNEAGHYEGVARDLKNQANEATVRADRATERLAELLGDYPESIVEVTEED